MAENFYTTGEAAAAIGVSRQTLQAWIAEGKITGPKVIGNTRVWNESELKKLCRFSNRRKAARRPKQKRQ
jgi:excisionase family DNA binding protein